MINGKKQNHPYNVVITIILGLLLTLSSCSEGDSNSRVGYYTCPMHPQVIQQEPGTCPICYMDLVYSETDKEKP